MIYVYPARLLHWIMAAGFAFMWLACAFLAAAAGHVLAALKHQWWDDYDILGRMTGDRDDRRAARRRIAWLLS